MSTAPASLITVSSRPSLLARLNALYARHETIRFLVTSDLKSGHRDKVLGNFWSLLDPLAFAAVYYVVFGVLYGQARGHTGAYLVYLVTGVFAFQFTQGAVVQAAGCIRGRRGLIHEISFPKAIFPIATCFSRLYDFLWGQVALLILVLLSGTALSLHVLWLPVIIFLNLLFAIGLALIVAVLGAFFADTVNVVSIAMRLLMYFCPLFYYVHDVVGDNGKVIVHGLIPPGAQFYYMLNPLACFFEAYRDCLLHARSPDPGLLLYTAVVAAVVLLVGFAVFTRSEGHFAKYI